MLVSKELKIGIFAVVVLVMSFFLINYLRGEDLLNREIELVSRYDDLQGLVASAPVYIKGFKAGEVSEVKYDPQSEDFLVTCSVSKDFRIPADSKMTIYSVDIMGGKGIRIDLGSASESAVDGSMLVASFEAGLMDGLSSGIAPLLEKVTNTLDSLSVTVAGINNMLSEENQNKISSILARIDNTMTSVSNISSAVDGKSAELEDFMTNLAALSEKFVLVADTADSTLSEISSVAEKISESDLQGMITSFKSLVENINDPDGSLGKLFTDQSVYNSIDVLLYDIDQLIRKIQENPKKYLRISVF